MNIVDRDQVCSVGVASIGAVQAEWNGLTRPS